MDYQNVGCPSLVVELKYCPQTRHNRVKMKDGPGLMIMKTFMTQLWYDARLYDPYSSWILVCWIETMNIIVGESLHGAPITVVSWPFEMRGFGVRVITNPRETPGEHSDDWSDCSPILSLKTAHWVFRASAHPSHHRAPCWHIHWYFHGILSDALRSFFGWSATSWHGIINFRRGRRFGGSREKLWRETPKLYPCGWFLVLISTSSTCQKLLKANLGAIFLFSAT